MRETKEKKVKKESVINEDEKLKVSKASASDEKKKTASKAKASTSDEKKKKTTSKAKASTSDEKKKKTSSKAKASTSDEKKKTTSKAKASTSDEKKKTTSKAKAKASTSDEKKKTTSKAKTSASDEKKKTTSKAKTSTSDEKKKKTTSKAKASAFDEKKKTVSKAKASTSEEKIKKTTSKAKASTSEKKINKTTSKTKTSKSETIKVSKVKNAIASNKVAEYYDLPYRYNQTVVKILAQTPHSLFIYWDISDDDKKAMTKKFGENFWNETRPVLLVHNKTLNSDYEIEVDDFTNSWYLHTPTSDCDFSIELGRKPIQTNEMLVSNKNLNVTHITGSNVLKSPNDHIMLESLDTVLFKNIKNNTLEEKKVSNLNVDKIYNLIDIYSENNYRNNPSSGFKIS